MSIDFNFPTKVLAVLMCRVASPELFSDFMIKSSQFLFV